jgi:hypothetical protein
MHAMGHTIQPPLHAACRRLPTTPPSHAADEEYVRGTEHPSRVPAAKPWADHIRNTPQPCPPMHAAHPWRICPTASATHGTRITHAFARHLINRSLQPVSIIITVQAPSPTRACSGCPDRACSRSRCSWPPHYRPIDSQCVPRAWCPAQPSPDTNALVVLLQQAGRIQIAPARTRPHPTTPKPSLLVSSTRLA